jgi:hypothetical protein
METRLTHKSGFPLTSNPLVIILHRSINLLRNANFKSSRSPKAVHFEDMKNCSFPETLSQRIMSVHL